MKHRTPAFVNALAIITILLVVFYMFVQDFSFLTSPYFWGTVVISTILAFIHGSIGDLIENEKFKNLSPENQTIYLKEKENPYFTRLYNSAFKQQSAKEEKDLIIDHGFDGIMELDNQLPKWWLGLFWFGFAYLVIYISSYALTDFAHPDKEYDAEHKAQLASIADYEKTAPQVTMETAKYSADNIAAGEEIFKTNCVSCHMDGGKGGIGPNLTDDTWINQLQPTLFKNVFYMVQNGSPKNPTMVAFGNNGTISGRDIEKVAAYIYHINQEIPDATGGAAPQGTPANWQK